MEGGGDGKADAGRTGGRCCRRGGAEVCQSSRIGDQEEKHGPFRLSMGRRYVRDEVVGARELEGAGWVAFQGMDEWRVCDQAHVPGVLPVGICWDKEKCACRGGVCPLNRCEGPTDGCEEGMRCEISVNDGAARPWGRVRIVDGTKEAVVFMGRVVVGAVIGDIEGRGKALGGSAEVEREICHEVIWRDP